MSKLMGRDETMGCALGCRMVRNSFEYTACVTRLAQRG